MLQPYLREVSRGKRRARDLTYEEAVLAMQALILGEYTDVQAGAFLIAERIKMESAEEIHGFVDALRAECRIEPAAGGLDCAGPFDGRVRTFFAAFPAAFVLSACGVPVTLPACPRLPPKNGITLLDLEREARRRASTREDKPQSTVEGQAGEAGKDTNSDASRVADSDAGLRFMAPVRIIDAEQWCPPLARFRKLREELGMRTLFNTVEKMLRFTDAPFLTVGIFHGTVFGKLAEAMLRMKLERALIVQGVEGSDDLPVDKRARCMLVSGETSEELVMDPASLGLQSEMPEWTWTPRLQVQTAELALKGAADLPFQNMTIWNSGVRLWLAGKAESVESGIEAARQTIVSGLAWMAYESWRSGLQPSS